MAAAIMNGRADATQDVRDMLCAQALAQVDRAMRRLSPGALLDVVGDTVEVKADLLVWASGLGHSVVDKREQADGWQLRLRKA